MFNQQVEKSTVLWKEFFNLKLPQIRTFHITWIAFFLCFFGWFGIAPLMPVVVKELSLTKGEIGNIMIASVSATVFARLIIGWLCDHIGPRKTYSGLLILGAVPVALIGLSNSYETLLISRLLIGVIGASFVITQYHTSVMFAPNVVGTANATSAGWGNMGGGVTNMVMPLVFGAMIYFGFNEFSAWRWSMVIPGIGLFLTGIAYYLFTQDYPEGNIEDLKDKHSSKGSSLKTFMTALKDYRVWSLFLIYGACFGVELVINNYAAIYFFDHYKLDLKTAGFVAGIVGVMALFARSLGGYFGDRFGIKWGLKGRVLLMGLVVLLEGVALIAFSQMNHLIIAVSSLMLFGLFVHMSTGATYSVVPFVNKKALGAVAGIVGAGGNAGAVAAGFLFRGYAPTDYSIPFLITGVAVVGISLLALTVRFSEQAETEARYETKIALQKTQIQAEGTL